MAQPTNDLPMNTYGPAEDSSSGQDLPFSAYGPAPTDAAQMSVSATSNLPPETWMDKAYDVITGPGSPFASPVENAKFTTRTGIPTSPFEEGLHSALGQVAVSVPAKIGAYFQNFGALHQTTNKTFSPEQVAAAKKLGIPLPTDHLNPNITGLLPNNFSRHGHSRLAGDEGNGGMGNFCILLHKLTDLGAQFVQFRVEGNSCAGHSWL